MHSDIERSRLLFTHALTGPIDEAATEPLPGADSQNAECKQASPRESRRPNHYRCNLEETDMTSLDLRGLVPAPVTPFTRDGEVDHAAIQRLGSWLGSFDGVKGLVVLGHAGEGTFLTPDEQAAVIRSFVESTDGRVPVIAGITLEGTKVAALEAKRAVAAGAAAGLVYPSHGWLRFGYQAIFEESGLPLILFQYPDVTEATYNLETQLEIAAQPGVFAMKNGVRNMRRWDTEIPVIRRERPDLQILTCHDEYLLHTMFDVDGALVGYGGLAPEPLIEFIAAGKAKDYARARAIHDRLLPVTRTVYHRGSHMEGTVALKHGLVARGILDHATVRSPLLPLEPGAEVEIADALRSAGLGGRPTAVAAE
jgi:4-hydroxy-tetrahydrodipicolinate synthase